MPTTLKDLATIETLAKTSPEKAADAYKKALTLISSGSADTDARLKEVATLGLGDVYKRLKRADDLANLIRGATSFLGDIPKAKTSKIVRTLIDLFNDINDIPNSQTLQIKVVKDLIEWAVTEKRVFLRQSLETRLVALYIGSKLYTEALALIQTLLKELKRLDDKAVLMEVQLLESRVYHALRNVAKSRAALTSARTSANAIYCPPLMQAALDMQSGILHADEKDYQTAYSYFFEALEGYSSQEDARATHGLKYMLLCKIMLGESDDVYSLLNGKMGLKYQGREVEAMKAVALAHQHRSLGEFEDALKNYKEELSNDPIIRSHLSSLYDTLLEANLLRVIEPFSKVEITHVAELVKLPVLQVENKLSQMILDKVFNGILDQGSGHLVLFEAMSADGTYEGALDAIKVMGGVAESLYAKAAELD